MNRFAFALTGALLGAAGLAPSARATLISVGNPLYIGPGSNSTSTGPEVVTLVSIACSGPGGAITCNNTNSYDNIEWGPDANPYGITITSSTGTLLSTAGNPVPDDITIEFTVGAGNSGTSESFSKVGILINGTDGGNTSYNSTMTSTEKVQTSGGTFTLPGGASYGQPEQYLNLYTSTPAGYSSLEVTKDINVTSTDPTTVAITSVNQDFVLVPEPTSLSIMLFGLTAAAAARRRRARR